MRAMLVRFADRRSKGSIGPVLGNVTRETPEARREPCFARWISLREAFTTKMSDALGTAPHSSWMRMVCAAASIGAVLVLSTGCGSSHARRGSALASFPSFPVSFRYPAAWNRIDCSKQLTSFIRTVTYLTTSHPGSCPSSSPPVTSLDAGGVLVWWWNWGFPGRNPISNFPGRPVTIGGQPARIATVSTQGAGTVAMPKPICIQLGSERLVEVAIERPAPARGELLMVTACLRGPKFAASEAAVRKMLTSVDFRK